MIETEKTPVLSNVPILPGNLSMLRPPKMESGDIKPIPSIPVGLWPITPLADISIDLKNIEQPIIEKIAAPKEFEVEDEPMEPIINPVHEENIK